MAPLLVLLATFVIALFTVKIIRKHYGTALAARIAMSVMLLFTSIGHFAFTQDDHDDARFYPLQNPNGLFYRDYRNSCSHRLTDSRP